jgi:hypothetical protein
MMGHANRGPLDPVVEVASRPSLPPAEKLRASPNFEEPNSYADSSANGALKLPDDNYGHNHVVLLIRWTRVVDPGQGGFENDDN